MSNHDVIFNSIKARNFRSIGPNALQMDFTGHDHTLVVSEDNGAGKSTLLIHALYYLLFDKAYGEDDKKTSLVNSNTRKDLLVEASITAFGRELIIKRGQKPTVFEILVQKDDGNFHPYDQEASLKDPQALLEQLVPIDQTSFVNAIALGVDQFKPFIFMKTAQRRPFVEHILGLGVFTDMAVKAKETRSSLTREASDLDHAINRIAAQVDSEKQIYDIQEANAQDRIGELEARVAELEPKYAAAQKAESDGEAKLGAVKAKLAGMEAEVRDQVSQAETANSKKLDSLKADKEAEIAGPIADRDAELKAFDERAADERSKRKSEALSKVQQVIDKHAEEIALRSADVDLAKSELDSTVESLNSVESASLTGKRALDDVRHQIEVNERNIASKQKDIDDIYHQTNCPTCRQSITDDMKDTSAESLKADMAKLVEVSSNLTDELSDANGKYDTLCAQIESWKGKFKEAQAAYDEAKAQLAEAERVRDVEKNEQQRLAVEEIGSLDSRMKDERRDIEVKHDKIISDITTAWAIKEQTWNSTHQQNISSIREAASEAQSNVRQLLATVETQYKADRNRCGDLFQDLNITKSELEQQKSKPKFDFEAQRNKIAKLEDDLTKSQTAYDEIDARIKALTALIDKVLTDKGIKASIVDKYLPFLNKRVNDYLHAMNLYLNLEMDTNYNITMNAPDRRGQTVYSLSNGQKARLNVAYMLAWRDIADMRSSVSTNLMALDETLENVSENGVKETIDLVKQSAKGKNLFVVSQRNSEFEEHFGNVIKYALRNQVTEVVN